MKWRVLNRLRSLWGKIQECSNHRRTQANHCQNPAAPMPTYRYRTVQHHPTAHEKQHRAAEQDYWQEQLRLAKELNWLTRVLNWITAIGAVGAAAGLFFLWKTLTATEMAANAALVQAQAAREAIRAKMVITKARKITDFTATAGVLTYIDWKNVGGSTALDVMVDGAVLICRSAEDQVKCIERQLPNGGFFANPSLSKGPVGPGVDGTIPIMTLPIPPQIVEEIKNGTRRTYFVGVVRYRDLFSDPQDPQDYNEVANCVYFDPNLNAAAVCPTGGYEKKGPQKNEK